MHVCIVKALMFACVHCQLITQFMCLLSTYYSFVFFILGEACNSIIEYDILSGLFIIIPIIHKLLVIMESNQGNR